MTKEHEWHIGRSDLEGVATARHEFSDYLCGVEADGGKRYDAALIFGELVANAVKCARTSTTVELLKGDWAVLRVVDDGDCFDPSSISPQMPYAQSGRGLYIAKTLARDLNVRVSDTCCEVTAVLPITFPRNSSEHRPTPAALD